MLKRHRAGLELIAVHRAALRDRIAQRHLLRRGGILVVGLHHAGEVLTRADLGQHGVRAGQTGQAQRIGVLRLGQGRLVRRRLRLLLVHRGEDAVHQAHVFGGIKDILLGEIGVDEAVHVGVIGSLLLLHLRVVRLADLLLGHLDALDAQRVQVIQHALELRALVQGVVGVAGSRQLLRHDGIHLVLGDAVAEQVLRVVALHLIERRLCLRLIALIQLRGQHIAGLLGMALGDALAQLHLHGFLRDGVLEIGVILVHLVAVLRIVGDVGIEHLVEFLLHLGHQDAHRAVIGGRQHDVLVLLRRRAQAGQAERQRQQQGQQLLHVHRSYSLHFRLNHGLHYTCRAGKTQ